MVACHATTGAKTIPGTNIRSDCSLGKHAFHFQHIVEDGRMVYFARHVGGPAHYWTTETGMILRT